MTLVERALQQLPDGPPRRPADLDVLISRLGVHVNYVRTARLFDGATDVSGAVPVIELGWVAYSQSRSLLPWPPDERLSDLLPHHYDSRTRFTLAHEIGHVLLHRLSFDSALPARLDGRSVERLCNSIAAELLMPTSWFRRRSRTHEGIALVRRVALEAGVSITSATVRARDLGTNIVVGTLSRDPSRKWGGPRWLGIASGERLELDDRSVHELNAAPCRDVRAGEILVRCRDHEHGLSGQIRTTYRSALGVFTEIDGRPVRGSRLWRCPEPCAPAPGAGPPPGAAGPNAPRRSQRPG
jgi:hypothetical protein